MFLVTILILLVGVLGVVAGWVGTIGWMSRQHDDDGASAA
jgi:hypothetical protein